MALIQVKNLSFCYDGSYEYIFDDVSFVFDSSFKTALIGRNARGKTTFLKLLMGEYEYHGEIIKSVNIFLILLRILSNILLIFVMK